MPSSSFLLLRLDLFTEITLVQSHETSAMTSLVLCHLMNCVVCCIHTCSLSVLGNTELVLACTTLSSNTCLKIALSILQHITQQFSELACMLSLLKSITLESLSNFRISLAISLTAHS